MLANVGSAGESGTVERPGAIVLSRPVPPYVPPAADDGARTTEAPEGGDPTEGRR